MTPIMPQIVKTLLVFQPLLKLEHVVDNVIRMVGDERIAGRMLALGPQGWSEDVEVGGGLEEVETSFKEGVIFTFFFPNTCCQCIYGSHHWLASTPLRLADSTINDRKSTHVRSTYVPYQSSHR